MTLSLANLLLVVPLAALLQPGSVELQLGGRILDVGEAVNVQLVCTNLPDPQIQEVLASEGIDLRLQQATPIQTTTQIINGRRTEHQVYSLRLVAHREGTFEVGPVRVTAEGEVYEAPAVKVTVRATPTTSDYIFVEMEVEPRELYVTQTYNATLRLGIRVVEMQGREVDMDLFRNVLDQRSSEFSVFVGQRGSQRTIWRPDANGQRRRFEVLEIDARLRADEVGTIEIGPVFVKADYPTAVKRDWRLGYAPTRTRKETARAEAIEVTVKPPPDEGKPADFTGALGHYLFQASATPAEIEQGQPITLTLKIRGQPLEGVPGVNLSAQPELASRFDFTEDELVGTVEQGAKVFRRALFPRQVGEQTIPSILWSYFDVASEQYVTCRSAPIPIVVTPRPEGAAPLALGAGVHTRPGANGVGLTLLGGGISPNYVDAEAVLANQQFVLTPAWIAGLAVTPVVWLGVTLMTRHRARLRADAGWARRRRARAQAEQALRRALRAPDATSRATGLADALTGYLRERFNLATGQGTPVELELLITEHGGDLETAGAVAEFLTNAEATRYAPGTAAEADSRRALAQIREWIRRIENTTR